MHEHLQAISESLNSAYRDLDEVNAQLRNNGGAFDPSRMGYFNQLTHAIKSLETTKAMLEAKEGEDRGEYGDRGRYGYGWRMPYPPIYRGYYDGGYGENYGRERDGGYGRERDGGYGRERDGGYGRNQDRDSRGRYADDGMRDKLRTLMANTRDESTRMELQRMMDTL